MDYKLYMMKSNRADLELRIRVYEAIKGTPVFTYHGPRQRLNNFEKWVNLKRAMAFSLMLSCGDIYRLASNLSWKSPAAMSISFQRSKRNFILSLIHI